MDLWGPGARGGGGLVAIGKRVFHAPDGCERALVTAGEDVGEEFGHLRLLAREL